MVEIIEAIGRLDLEKVAAFIKGIGGVQTVVILVACYLIVRAGSVHLDLVYYLKFWLTETADVQEQILDATKDAAGKAQVEASEQTRQIRRVGRGVARLSRKIDERKDGGNGETVPRPKQ